MFFFFYPQIDILQFRPGQLCEIVSVNLPIFADNIGRKIIITKAVPDMQLVWAHDARPPRYGINRNGKRVKEYDPRMCESLYNFNQLRVLEGKEEKDLRYFMSDSW
jgi:hypothetical protein